MDKAEVARRLLGTALDLFLRVRDPVAVHCLAMAGGEIAESLVEKGGGEPFKNHVLETFPDMNIKELRDIQRRYSNAFKHATDRQGKDREDESILTSFDGSVNDATLFIGWYDYGAGGFPRPIEAQVLEAWYLAKHPEKVNPDANVSGFDRVFPSLQALSPRRQHERLLDVIKKARKNGTVMSAAGTDRRPLILPWER